MCDCLNSVLEKVKQEVVKQKNITEESKLEINWKDRCLRFDGKPNNVMLPIKYSFWKKRVNGQRYKNKTDEQVSMSMTYCPFCGDKYE